MNNIKTYTMDNKYWKNKPVLKFGETCKNIGFFENIIERDIYKKKEPINLPSYLSWIEIKPNYNINDPIFDCEKNLLKNFLKENYQTFKTNFYYDYTFEQIIWLLGNQFLLLGLINKNTKKIIAIIGGGIKNTTMFTFKNNNCGFVEFICIEDTLRNKGIFYILTDEFIRRLLIMSSNINHGYFITNKKVPSPITKIRYYARPLNYTKLFESDFLKLQDGKNTTMNKFNKIFKINDTLDSNCIKLNDQNIEKIHKIYSEWSLKFNIYIEYNLQSFKERFLGHEFVNSYVFYEDSPENPIDFMSFYYVEYMSKKTNIKIKTAHLIAYSDSNITLSKIIKNMSVICLSDNVDIIFVNDSALIGEYFCLQDRLPDEDSEDDENNQMTEDKFMKIDDNKYLNLFNFQCPRIKTKQLNLL
jgi:hypothetical protein